LAFSSQAGSKRGQEIFKDEIFRLSVHNDLKVMTHYTLTSSVFEGQIWSGKTAPFIPLASEPPVAPAVKQ